MSYLGFLIAIAAPWWLSYLLASLSRAIAFDRKLARDQQDIKESLALMQLDAAYAHAWATIEALHYGDPTPEELAIRELRERSGVGQAVPLGFGVFRQAPVVSFKEVNTTGRLRNSVVWLEKIDNSSRRRD